MGSWQTWILVGLGLVALGAVGWMLVHPTPSDSGAQTAAWTIVGTDPLRVGTLAEPYAYDGEAVQSASGSVTLQIAPDLSTVSLDVAIVLGSDVGLEALRPFDRPIEQIAGGSSGVPVDVWTDVTIHGLTGRGDELLPPTRARWAGVSSFRLEIDGFEYPDTTVLWSVADALRRSDGAIRQQGLVYSPLLRDKTGFSDPTRTELTLIVRSSDGIFLQLVFRDVLVADPTDLTSSP